MEGKLFSYADSIRRCTLMYYIEQPLQCIEESHRTIPPTPPRWGFFFEEGGIRYQVHQRQDWYAAKPWRRR